MCIQNEHVQGSPFTVQVVQSGGMILKFGRKGINMGEFNGIFGVAVDPVEGRIVVTDCHNHRVQVFSSDGIFLFHFGRKGEGSGEFQCPTGVAIDVRGQIIVCERLSYRLQVGIKLGENQWLCSSGITRVVGPLPLLVCLMLCNFAL